MCYSRLNYYDLFSLFGLLSLDARLFIIELLAGWNDNSKILDL